MPEEPIPGPTPTGYQRTQGGGVKWQPPTAEHLGKLLPQYEVEALVGRGGMGAVYKGRQKSLDRPVAIKILPPEVDDEDGSYTERFKNEAKVMAKFTHPAIVAVHDFGETSEGQLFFIMEFVNGTDVHQMIEQQGRLPPEHALAITAHVCDALKYAHEHGVIHRDIKPSNVLINMEGAVKVADFGLAKLDDAGAIGLTKGGMAMGTPDFVAPETLIMGVNVDGRADLYAVGVMLYNMLTGNVPRGAFKPASVLVPGLDPRFDAIATRAMQHDREDRYKTATEMRRDLDVILTTPLVKSGGPSSAAIPKQALPPDRRPGVAQPARPARVGGKGQIKAGANAQPAGRAGATPSLPPAKSKAPFVIGLVSAAVIAAGAFYMLGGKKPDVARNSDSESSTPRPQNSVSENRATPIKVREEPKVGQASSLPAATKMVAPPSEPPKKEEPKPVASAPTTPAPAAPANPPAVAQAKPVAPPSPAASATPAKPGPQPARLPDPAKWVKVFETRESVVPFGSKAEWTDQGIRLNDTLQVPGSSHTDAAVRAKILFGPGVILGLRNGDSGFRVIGTNTSRRIINVQKRRGKDASTDAVIAEFSFDPASSTATEIEVEFVAVGKVLKVSVDGNVVGSVLDADEPASGMVTLYSSTRGLIRDIAWQSLDLPNPSDEKLATLERAYQERIKSEADAPFETAVAELAAKLKAALERAVPSVRGSPAELHLRAEIVRIEKKEPIPPADEPKIPGLLVTLRKTWHAELGRLLAIRVQNAAPAKKAHDQALAAFEKELEDKGDITRSERVKQARAALLKPDAAPAAGGLAVVKRGPVNVRPTKAGKLKVIGCFDNAALPVDAEPFSEFDDYVQVAVGSGFIAGLRSNGGALVQRLKRGMGGAASTLETFEYTGPPVARLTCWQPLAEIWGLTEEGQVLKIGAGDKPVTDPCGHMTGLVDFSGDRGRYAGLKADGTIVYGIAPELAADSQWMPKPETLPTLKSVWCRPESLVVLTNAGAVMGWHRTCGEFKSPTHLRRGIVRLKEGDIHANKDTNELSWYGTCLDRQGGLFKGMSSSVAAKNAEDFAGYGSLWWPQQKKLWVVDGAPGIYGELQKAREVFSKGTPVAFDQYAGSTGNGTTGIFAWIE